MLRTLVKTYRDVYSGLPRAVWMLVIVDLVNSSGTMVIFFMTLYLVQKLHYPLDIAGQAISAYGVGALVGAYLGGWICDRIQGRNVLAGSLFFSGVMLISLSFSFSLLAILGLMFGLGMFNTSFFPANATVMSQICPKDLLTQGFALSRLARNLGVTIGPVLGGYLALFNYQYLFLVDGFTSLIAAGLLIHFFQKRETCLDPLLDKNGTSPWGDHFFLWLILLVFLLGVIFNQLFSTFSVYLNQAYGLRENRIGQLLAVNTIMIVLFEMVLLHWLRNFQPMRVAAFGALCLGGGFSLMPAGHSYEFAALTVAIWTVGEMLTIPILSGFVTVRGSGKQQGKYQGLFSLAFAFASMFGPILGTRVYEKLGPIPLWEGAGGLGFLVCVGFVWLESRTNRGSTE